MKNVSSLPFNFGGLEPEYAAYEGCNVVVVPVPYEATTTFRAGTKEGPLAIIKASRGMELYDDEMKVEPYLAGIHTLDEVDLSLANMEYPHAQMEDLIEMLAEEGKFPIILGGEHSISLGPVRAFAKRYPDLTVLQLDAHADMRDTFQGTPFSHACIARRISEICPIVQVGIRSMSREEGEFLQMGQGENVLSGMDFARGKVTFTDVLDKLSDNVYVTVDVDVFDPSEMPAVGTPEPGGLHWYQVLDILGEVFDNRNVVGFDLVELCPIPGDIAPDFLAAKLVYKMIGRKFADVIK